ncbi:MAG: hypothetical protein GQ574_28905 [Crocinitomix sp.]|nr:hypothetical protein [Crocinitomix sp.]
MRLTVAILLIIVPLVNFAQGGYLGAKNSFEIEFCNVPSIKTSFELNHKKNYTKTTNRFAYTSFAINYSRVIDKNVEVTFRYRYARASAPFFGSVFLKTDSIYIENEPLQASHTKLNFLEDPKTNLHFYSFDFKYFRYGSIAPLGKYIGLELEFGFGKFLTTDDIYVGKGDVAKFDNFLIKKKEVIELETVHVPNDINGKITGVYMLVGRTYPINDFLLFSVGMKFPFLSTVVTQNSYDLGQGAQKASGYSFRINSTFDHIISGSLGKYTRTSLNVGLKLMF